MFWVEALEGGFVSTIVFSSADFPDGSAQVCPERADSDGEGLRQRPGHRGGGETDSLRRSG